MDTVGDSLKCLLASWRWSPCFKGSLWISLGSWDSVLLPAMSSFQKSPLKKDSSYVQAISCTDIIYILECVILFSITVALGETPLQSTCTWINMYYNMCTTCTNTCIEYMPQVCVVGCFLVRGACWRNALWLIHDSLEKRTLWVFNSYFLLSVCGLD